MSAKPERVTDKTNGQTSLPSNEQILEYLKKRRYPNFLPIGETVWFIVPPEGVKMEDYSRFTKDTNGQPTGVEYISHDQKTSRGKATVYVLPPEQAKEIQKFVNGALHVKSE